MTAGERPELPFGRELRLDRAGPWTPPVKVTRSRKRKKTIQARIVDGVVHVSIPAWMTAEQEADAVSKMLGKFGRRFEGRADLEVRAAALAKRFGLPLPSSIRWVDNQRSRWGSCTPSTKTIRISSAVVDFPEWVIDYVVLHELAHLVVPGHGPDFWKIVEQYPRCERARGYLIAKSGELEGDVEE